MTTILFVKARYVLSNVNKIYNCLAFSLCQELPNYYLPTRESAVLALKYLLKMFDHDSHYLYNAYEQVLYCSPTEQRGGDALADHREHPRNGQRLLQVRGRQRMWLRPVKRTYCRTTLVLNVFLCLANMVTV